MDKVLILSDLHHDGSAEADAVIRAGLAHALARHGDARAIILSGDLTQSGKPAEYRALGAILSRVRLPVIPMTGNLDRRCALLAAFPGAPVTDEGHVQGVLDTPRHRIITLDTLIGPPYRTNRHEGQLCPDRMAWLMRALERAGDRHRVVIAHHPAMKLGIPGMDALRLDGGPDLLELLAGFPGTLLIAGHVHRAASGVSRGTAWATLGALRGPFALTLDSDDIRPGTQAGSYGVLLLQKHGAVLHQQDLPD